MGPVPYVGSKAFLKGWKPGFLSNLANSLLLDPERRVKSMQILADPDPVPQQCREFFCAYLIQSYNFHMFLGGKVNGGYRRGPLQRIEVAYWVCTGRVMCPDSHNLHLMELLQTDQKYKVHKMSIVLP
jgi:hypothetical protein